MLLAAQQRYIQPDTTRWTTTSIDDAIEDAQQQIEDETGLYFDEQAFTETYSGYDLNGGYNILLNHYPILEITTLEVDGNELTEDEDYYITNPTIGRISFESSLPTIDYNNVVVTGFCGYTDGHPTAKRLCEDIVLFHILTNRETPPHFTEIIQSSGRTDIATLKPDDRSKIMNLVFDIKARLRKLPHKALMKVI